MTAFLIAVVIFMICGYGIYQELMDMFIAGVVGFVGLAINGTSGLGSLMGYLSFVAIIGSLSVSAYMFTVHYFL